jgi:hypothetical protein
MGTPIFGRYIRAVLVKILTAVFWCDKVNIIQEFSDLVSHEVAPSPMRH